MYLAREIIRVNLYFKKKFKLPSLNFVPVTYTYCSTRDGRLLPDFNPETCLRIEPEPEGLAVKNQPQSHNFSQPASKVGAIRHFSPNSPNFTRPVLTPDESPKLFCVFQKGPQIYFPFVFWCTCEVLEVDHRVFRHFWLQPTFRERLAWRRWKEAGEAMASCPSGQVAAQHPSAGQPPHFMTDTPSRLPRLNSKPGRKGKWIQ